MRFTAEVGDLVRRVCRRSLTNGVRVELAHQGTLVVGVHASFVETDMTKRIGSPCLVGRCDEGTLARADAADVLEAADSNRSAPAGSPGAVGAGLIRTADNSAKRLGARRCKREHVSSAGAFGCCPVHLAGRG
jgi:NAD(P)-dependent dehydrogenase (short-subunit alcohol dehydrogenase family)